MHRIRRILAHLAPWIILSLVLGWQYLMAWLQWTDSEAVRRFMGARSAFLT